MSRSPFTLTTERLRLRSWREADIAPFAALNADPRVMEFYPRLATFAESEVFAKRANAKLFERGFGLWAVEAPGLAPFIGYVGLAEPSFSAHFTPCVEIGWRLAWEHWGRGYATEAARAALRHAFGFLGLQEVVSFTAQDNWRSRRVMERLGMRHSPTDDFHHPSLPEGHALRRHVLFRLNRNQWRCAVGAGVSAH